MTSCISFPNRRFAAARGVEEFIADTLTRSRLTPGRAQVCRYAGNEPVWLDQSETDENHALFAGFAKRFGTSLGAVIAYARWPRGLAEVRTDTDDSA